MHGFHAGPQTLTRQPFAAIARPPGRPVLPGPAGPTCPTLRHRPGLTQKPRSYPSNVAQPPRYENDPPTNRVHVPEHWSLAPG